MHPGKAMNALLTYGTEKHLVMLLRLFVTFLYNLLTLNDKAL